MTNFLITSSGEKKSLNVGKSLLVPAIPRSTRSRYHPYASIHEPRSASRLSTVRENCSSIPLANKSIYPYRSISTSTSSSVKPSSDDEISPLSPTIYEFSPAPLSPLDHFEKWFPESPTEAPRPSTQEKSQPLLQEKATRYINKALPPPPYHVFERRKKRELVFLVAFAGVLSPLSMSIYFSTLAAISNEFKISKSQVLLTITVYIAVQGLAPFLLMPLCNTFGRRPLLIITLFIFLCSNIGLLFSHSFLSLTLLRGLQSLGTATLTATCTAVIGDISTERERKKYIGVFGSILMFTFISPMIGGLLTSFFGWRTIFWFLGGFGLLVLISVILFLPETLRSIAEDGNIRLGYLQQPLIIFINPPPIDNTLREPDSTHTYKIPLTFLSAKTFLEPVYCLKQKDILLSTIFGAVVFAICTTVIVTTTTMISNHRNLSAISIGLAFLPAGAGSVISFFCTGYLTDRDLRVTEAHYRKMHRLDSNISLDPKQLHDFPIERARLRSMWWITIIFIASVTGYGFAFEIKTPALAIPLIVQFIIAASATSILLMNGILLNDLSKLHTSATLAVNCVRFMTAALAVGTVQLSLDKIGSGCTFLIFANIMIAVTPIPIAQWFFGKPWVARRNSTWPRQRLVRFPEWESSREMLVEKVKGIRGARF